MKTDFKLYINGKAVPGEGDLIKVYAPATGELIAEYRAASVEQTEEALQGAKAAFPVWSATSINYRIGWMKKLNEAVLNKGLVRNDGKQDIRDVKRSGQRRRLNALRLMMILMPSFLMPICTNPIASAGGMSRGRHLCRSTSRRHR